ncbi:unnamed protein product [Leuciscus chuanchicus]
MNKEGEQQGDEWREQMEVPTPPSFFRSPSTEPQVSESIKSERRRARSFTEVNIKLQGTAGRERESKREIEEGRASPPSLIRRIDQPGMRPPAVCASDLACKERGETRGQVNNFFCASSFFAN